MCKDEQKRIILSMNIKNGISYSKMQFIFKTINNFPFELKSKLFSINRMRVIKNMRKLVFVQLMFYIRNPISAT